MAPLHVLNSNPPPDVWQRFLHGIWRETPPALHLSADEWEQLVPRLRGTSIEPLAWRRVSQSPLSGHELAQSFKTVHRREFLRARLVVEQLETLIQTLRAGGVEAVPIKGWLQARHYADVGLRPIGDIDLCVQSADFGAAVQILKASGGLALLEGGVNRVQSAWNHEEQFHFPDAPQGWCLVELHAEITDLHARIEPDWETLLARGQTLKIGVTTLRALAPEDHLRLSAIHFWRHEASRPLWLCDLSAALEARGENWNWEKCLGRDAPRANWVQNALLVARELTGVSLQGAPFEDQKPARWLPNHVVRSWENPVARSWENPVARPEGEEVMWNYFRQPARLWRERAALQSELRRRWPTPILATLCCERPLKDSPQLRWQLLYSASLAGNFVAHLPQFWRRERQGRGRGRKDSTPSR